ncbi:hypothetical protein QUA79_20500 [Microcoleus sp. F8-D1]
MRRDRAFAGVFSPLHLFAIERKNNLFLSRAIAPRRSQNPGVSSLRRKSCSRRKTI